MLSAHPSTTPVEARALNRPRRLAVEALGCGLLVVALEGAHHGAEHLGVSATDGRLFMSLAAGVVLACLTLVLQPLSGAHFNPALTFADALEGGTPWREVPRYVLAQLGGGLAGRWVAHLMCGEPLLIATRAPSASSAQFISELVATFGLLVVVRGCVRARPSATHLVVAGYVAATVWFTDSRSLANPALILARAVSTRTSALHPLDVESFVAAQILGAALAMALFRWLMTPSTQEVTQRTWRVIFQCSKPAVAEKAAEVFNGLAAPEFARGTVEGALCEVDPREPPPLVVRLVLEGELEPRGDGAVWNLGVGADGEGRLQASLREHTQRLLRTRGWSRLRIVGDPAHEAPGPTA
ncbi:MIP family channel protein [Myxococcus stipitatus DSM 14675]|uniref:MIP family channel protein n=1 Tax=Myxococcus stipitatus (strain DSM 14675 / JCM 12634 / Mx s8) TaxID=1278073 RepID=L7UAG2_MYXSD|nr:MIP/aquaporin family protein [Myxococcus stipitatus]AGC45048.1 MIP family channel protein [Myxococcus stipitatus DSM 14675]